MTIKRIPTGVLSLDMVLGGGLPTGRVIEIYGQKAVGKTSLSFHLMSQFQKLGRPVIYFDLEDTGDLERLEFYGVKTGESVENPVWLPHHGEDEVMFGQTVFELIERMAEVWRDGLVVIDSIPAMVSKITEEDIAYTGGAMASTARLMSASLRRMVGTNVLGKHNLTVIFINQTRQVLDPRKPISRPGGDALGYFASVALEVKNKEKIKGDIYVDGVDEPIASTVIGHKLHITTTKNKVFRPNLTAELPLNYDSGFDLYEDTLMIGVKFGVVKRAGAYFSYNEHRWQGIANAKAFFEENTDVYDTMVSDISNKIKE